MKLVKLSNVKRRVKVKIVEINLPKNESIRLFNFGINIGKYIVIIKNKGSMILMVNGKLIAVSKAVADNILVEYEDSNCR